MLVELEGRLAPIARVRDNGELALSSHSLPISILTSRVRLHIYSGVNAFNIFLNELELIGIAPATTTTFTDVPDTPGFYDYTLGVIDRLGGMSDEAGPVNLGVGDLTPPEPPTALDATIVEVDAWLSWAASVSVDVVLYRVFRDGAALVDVTTTSYVDRDLLNGTYTYHVVAIDDVGNVSLPSNEAEATVDVAPPEPPVLSLSLVPAGSALALSWTESSGPLPVSDYLVLRSVGVGGPYAEVARVGSTTLTFVDRGLANGVEIFYVVRAVDLRGQSSSDSNEVSGTPEDVEPPPLPIWVAPTTPDRPLTVNASRVSLIGIAEPGSEVDILRDGASMGTAVASRSFDVIAKSFLGTADNVEGRFAISPDRRFVVEVGSSFGFDLDTEARLYDLETGGVRMLAYGGDRSFERGAAVSPNGRWVAVATTLGGDAFFALRVLNLDSETTQVVVLTAAPQAPAWVSDEEVALVVGDAVVVFDLVGSIESTLYTSTSGFPPERLSVSLDGEYFAWLESDELLVMPSAGGGAELVVRDFSLDDFVWTDARTLAFTLFDVGLHIYDVDTSTQSLLPGTEGMTTPRSLGVVELVDLAAPGGPATVASTEGPLTVGAREMTAGQLAIDTVGLAVGRYTVVLSAVASTLEALDWSSATLFATPAAPSLNAPANGASAAQHIDLSVNNASNPNEEVMTYEFELYFDPGLTTLIGAASGLPEGANTTAWSVLQFLQENRRYYWRARGADRFATSDWMAPAEVFVDTANEAPGAPTLSEPAEGGEVATLLPTLVVGNALDPEGGPSTYTFEIYRGFGATDLVEGAQGVLEGSATTSFTPSSNLEEDQTYTWRARTNDGELDSTWMPEATFRVNTANHPPNAPAPIAPSAVTVPTQSPELVASTAVDPEGDALTYTFQIDLREAFDSPARQESLALAEMRWTPVAELDENGVYFWRVRASDGAATSPWSETARFRVDVVNEPPSTPTPQRPADRSFVESVTPVLAVVNAMDPEEDALTYTFEVYEDDALTQIVASIDALPEGGSETAWEVSPRLEEARTYYWRAHANDATSDGPFSSPQSFVVNAVNAEPSAPTRIAPAEGANVAELTPVLVVGNAFDPDGDALGYRFEVYEDEFLSRLVEEATDIPEGAGTTSFTMSAPLQENHLYYWRARAFDGLLGGPWMDTARFRFSRDSEPPTSPAPDEPADGSLVAGTRPTLVVTNATDPEEDLLRYRFYVYRDFGMTELVASSPDVDEGPSRTSWQVTLDLVENETYFWHALATDGDLESPPSEIFRFTVNALEEPPSVPALVLPADGSSVATPTPTLVVDNATSLDGPVGEPLHYHFTLYTDEALADLLVEDDAVVEGASGQTTWEPPVTLDEGATYYWRARAIDVRGLVSAWTSSFRFTVEPPSSECPPEWQDDFERYPLGKSPEGWQLEKELFWPRFRVTGGEDSRRLSSSVTGRGSLLFAGTGEAFGWHDYELSGEVSQRGFAGPDRWRPTRQDYAQRHHFEPRCFYRTGVVFYARPAEGTAYRLELTGPHCKVPRARLVKRVASRSEVLAEIELDRHLDEKRPLRFLIEAVNETHGTSLRVSLSGLVKKKEREWLLAFEDTESPLRSGTVGAWSNFIRASWDDFHVRQIEGLTSGISGDADGDGVCDGASSCGEGAHDCHDDDDSDDDDSDDNDRVNRARVGSDEETDHVCPRRPAGDPLCGVVAVPRSAPDERTSRARARARLS